MTDICPACAMEYGTRGRLLDVERELKDARHHVELLRTRVKTQVVLLDYYEDRVAELKSSLRVKETLLAKVS